MKNSKGISLITLVITIIVLIILASIPIIVSDDSADRTEKASFDTEKLELKKALTQRYANYLQNENASPLIGIAVKTEAEAKQMLINLGRDLTTIEQSEFDKIFKYSDSKAEYYRILEKEDVMALGIKNVNNMIEYSYVVNYALPEVIGPVK